MDRKFIPGLRLAEDFYNECVFPIIKEYYPDLLYAAALLGPGSEILGFDDITSTDHHWGPRLQLFLEEDRYIRSAKELDEVLSENLPPVFHGYSTNWSEPDPNDSFNQFLVPIASGPVNHRVEIHSVCSFLKKHLIIDLSDLSEIDWLLLPEQKLLEFTSGKVFHDSTGELLRAREKLFYYPENVWHFKLLSEWELIGQEMAFVGRTGSIGDDLGSRIEATRIVRFIIRLTFLLHKQYTPYPKWLGTGFRNLPGIEKLENSLLMILREQDWRKREQYLCEAYLILIDMQNKLDITPKIVLKPKSYYSRDQLVVDIRKITAELQKTIQPPLNTVKHPIGSIDQFTDNTYILTDADFARKAWQFYDTTYE